MQILNRTRPRGGIQSTRSLSSATAVGALAGLAGTLVMDLFGLVVLLVNGGPDTISFSLIGDAAATFASRVGIAVPGGTPLGVLLHYLIGVVLGAAFGAGVSLHPSQVVGAVLAVARLGDDLERSTAFYRALGLTTTFDWEAEDGSRRLRQMRLGDGMVELFAYPEIVEPPAGAIRCRNAPPCANPRRGGPFAARNRPPRMTAR